MRKKILRKLAAALAAVMVITNLSPLTAVVSAEELATTYETTYYLSQLQVVGGWGNSVNADPAGTAIHFNQQYSEVDYGIPAEVVESGLVSVNVDASSSEHLALKFLDNNGNQQAVDYSKTVLVADRSKENVRLGIMNKDEGEWDITVGAVTFVTASPIGETAKVPSSTTYTLDELGGIGGYNYTREGNVFTFEDEYKLASFAIPEEVLAAKLISVQVVTEDLGNFAIKVLSTADDELAVEYGKTTIAVPSDKLDTAKRVGLMSLSKGVSSVSATGFVFVTEDSVSKAVTPSEPTEPETPSEVMEKTYSIDELTVAGGYGCEVKTTDSGSEFSFNGQWQEMMYAIPEEIMKAGVKKVSITVVSGDVSKIALKERNASGDELNAVYGSTEMFITNTETVSVGIMNGADVAASYVISGVTFTTKYPIGSEVPEEPELPEESTEARYYDRMYFMDELTNVGGYGYTEVPGAYSTDYEFNNQYQEVRFAIPAEVLAAGFRGLTVEVTNNNAGALSLKVQDEEFKQLAVTYGSDSITYVGDDAKNFALMNREEGAQTIAIASVTFHTEKGFPLPKERTFSFDELTVTGGYGYTADINSNNTVIDYSGQYQEVRFAIPAEVLAAGFKSFTVNVTNGNTGALSLKVQDDGFNQLAVVYGSDSISYTGENAKNFALMNLTAGADTIAASGVTFYAEKGIEGAEIRKRAAKPVANENERTLKILGEDITLIHRSDDAEEVGNTVTFSRLWDEYYMELGETINMEKIKSVSVKVKDQGNTVSYKLYDKTDKELQAFYGKNGNTVLAPSNDGMASRFAVMGHVENDDTAYPFSITIESVEIVIDTTVTEVVDKEVEYDIVDLRDSVAETMGEDFLIGTAVSYQEFADAKEMELVTKHFKAVTLGNELKPDSILGSGNNNLQKVTLNGVTFDFPTLTYSTPEKYLDFFLKWNDEHPDKQIKIRGHVLVWHSQTPTWFFREGYSASGAYVSKEEMDLRLEYYIKSVCEHFTAEGSKYKGMFYGWDVVNEAVSDGGGYRKDFNGAPTDWWAVYGSNEFINKAFVFANKYMDPEVELYYNDYNDTQASKIGSIEQLLRDVKATPGARIDGFGMQAHYDVNSPSAAVFMDAARRYAAIVPSVQVTELDFKGSTGPTDEKLAKRYEDIYNAIRRLRDDGVNFTAMTIWGVTDKHSWLQNQSNVGGGSTSSSKQYPLLFDNNYKAKNSFWAIVNAGVLMPEIKTVTLVKSVDDKFTSGKEHSFRMGDKVVTFVPEWSEGTISVKVNVPDLSNDTEDKVVLYVYDGTETVKTELARSAAQETEDGYEAVLKVSADTDVIKSNKIKLDITVADGGKTYAFNDTRLKQETSTDYYAVTVIKAAEVVTKGTVTVDGIGDDAAWNEASEIVLAINSGADAEAKAKLLWDEDNLYVLVTVKDEVLDDTASQVHEKDSVELFIDENNAKASSYDDDDKQYRVNYKNEQSFNGTKCLAENIASMVTVTEDGYVLEAAIKWTDIEAKAGLSIGFDAQVNDAENGARKGTLNWADASGNGWSSPAVFGTIVLTEKEENTNPGQNPSANPGHNKDVNPGHNKDVNPGHNKDVNPGQSKENNPGHNPDVNPGRGPKNERPGRVDETLVQEVAEVPQETIKEVSEPVKEETKSNTAETKIEKTIKEPVTPLAPAITPAEATKSMGMVLMLAIGAAVVALGGIGVSLVIFKTKK